LIRFLKCKKATRMRNSTLVIFALLFVLTESHSQNQFSLNVDSSKTRLLSLNKSNRWPLSSKESIKLQGHNILTGPEITENIKGFESNMPIHKSSGSFPMVIHIPDSTICYKIQIVEPASSGKSIN